MQSGRGRFRTQSRQQPAQSPLQPDLAVIVQQLLIAAAEGRVSGGPQVRRSCQAGQVEGSGLGDCHGVAPLLPRALICPACAGLRAKKAEDYLRCTSTPATHWLLAAQHRNHTGASAALRMRTCTFFFLDLEALETGCGRTIWVHISVPLLLLLPDGLCKPQKSYKPMYVKGA